MTRRATAIQGCPGYREHALDTPRSDVFRPPPTGRELPVHPTRVALLTEHPAWAFVAAHGGSGTGLLTRLARQPYDAAVTAALDAGHPLIQLPTFAVNASRAWPDPRLERTGLVVVVCRTTMRGLAWARDLAAQYLSDRAPAGTRLLGVVTIADQPGRLPQPIAAAKGLLAGVYPRTWHVPYIAEYRLLTGLPSDDCAPIHPAVENVLAAIRSTVTPERTSHMTSLAAAYLAGNNPFTSNPSAIPGVTNLQTIIGYVCWIATALCMIGLIVTGATMAVSYHRGSNEHVGRLGGVAAGCLVVGAASPIAGAILGFNLFTSNPQAIPGLTGVQTVISYISWIAAALCLIGLITAGGMLAVSYQRGNSENAGRLGGVATGCLIVGGASTIIGALI